MNERTCTLNALLRMKNKYMMDNRPKGKQHVAILQNYNIWCNPEGLQSVRSSK